MALLKTFSIGNKSLKPFLPGRRLHGRSARPQGRTSAFGKNYKLSLFFKKYSI